MKRNDKRTTISLADVVWDMAGECMKSKGFNDNFSSYVADLIRRDKERMESQKPPAGAGDCGTKHGCAPAELSLNEPPKVSSTVRTDTAARVVDTVQSQANAVKYKIHTKRK